MRENHPVEQVFLKSVIASNIAKKNKKNRLKYLNEKEKQRELFNNYITAEEEQENASRIREYLLKNRYIWTEKNNHLRIKEKEERIFSISTKLKLQNKINDAFEIMLNQLTLEEVIGLKLEMASRSINNRLYNIPLYESIKKIVQDAVVKYAFSAARTAREFRAFLGIRQQYVKNVLMKHNMLNYFGDLSEEYKNDQEKFKKQLHEIQIGGD